MRSRLPVVAVLAVWLLAGCGTEAGSAPPAAATPSETVTFVGPSGLAIESEEAARAALEAQLVEAERAEAKRVAAEAAAQAAAEAAAQEAAQAAAARQAADEAAAAQAVIDAEGSCPPGWSFDQDQGCFNPDNAGGGDSYAEGDDGFESSDLEVRCSDGTATVEECLGPGADLNGNGIADVNE